MHMKRRFRIISIAGVSLCAVTAMADIGGKREALFVVGQAATVSAGEEIESALVIGGDLKVEGKVHGLAAAVGGDLHVGPGAVIDGPAASIGGELSIDEAARVIGPKLHVAAGDFSQVAAELSAKGESRRAPSWFGPAIRIMQVLAAFVLGLLLVLWAPQRVVAVRDALAQEPMKDALVGLAMVLGLAPFCVLLAMSIVGIPLIPLVVVFALTTFVFGLTAIAAAIGRKLRKAGAAEHLLAATSLGMLVLAVGASLPFLGALLLVMACIYGAGAVLATRFGTRPPAPRAGAKEPTPPPPAGTPVAAPH